jgi:hypothetical protein
MMTAEVESPPHRPLRCARCGELIGVYEPLVHVIGETVRRTSRAADPEIATQTGCFYHDGCYRPGGVSRHNGPIRTFPVDV